VRRSESALPFTRLLLIPEINLGAEINRSRKRPPCCPLLDQWFPPAFAYALDRAQAVKHGAASSTVNFVTRIRYVRRIGDATFMLRALFNRGVTTLSVLWHILPTTPPPWNGAG